jgi:hypothetical protein
MHSAPVIAFFMNASKRALLLTCLTAAAVASCSGGASPTDSQSPGNAANVLVTSAQPAVGESCSTGQPGRICLALDYIVYKQADGSTVTPEMAASVVHGINQIHAQCNIGFQIEKFAEVVPGDHGLSDGAGVLGELDQIREVFQNDSELLVVTTGPWGTPQIAWTQVPPAAGVYGSIISATSKNDPEVISHELGHYLGLDHVSDESDLMNPVVYATKLTSTQCDQMRATADEFWKKMYR